MTDKPKHIRTRTEAIALIRNNVFGLTDTGQAAKWVDFFIAAGMLEIKEEKVSFACAIQQHNLVPKNISLSCINDILAAIAAMGYEIKVK